MVRVAAYLRRSSPGEEDKNYSIENQLSDIKAWAEKEGHIVVQSYSDPGGKSFTLNRPVLQRMIADARDKAFDILAVWKFDRLSRIQDQSTVVVYQLKQVGVQVISITQPLPDGPVGNVLFSTYQFASEMELEGIRARTLGGKRARVHSGKLYPLPYPKYGYMFVDDKKERYLVDERVAPIVRRIFTLCAAGETIRGTARILTDEGVPTPAQFFATHYGFKNRGKPISAEWRGATIYDLLVNPGYIGKLVGNEYSFAYTTKVHPITKQIMERYQRTKRAENDPVRFVYPPEVCPPIISEDLWNRCQQRLSENKERASRNIVKPHNLVLRNGLGRCGYCGRGLSAHWAKETNNHRYFCLAHAKSIDLCPAPVKFSMNAAQLDNLAWEWFMEKLGEKERMQEFYERYQANVHRLKETGVSEISATQKALEEARDEEQSYLLAVGSARTREMRERFVALAEEAHERYSRLLYKLQEMEQRVITQQTEEDLVSSLQEMNEQTRKNLANATAEDKRLALYAYRVRALLYAKDHDPHYRFTWMFDEGNDDDQHSPNSDDGDGGANLSLHPQVREGRDDGQMAIQKIGNATHCPLLLRTTSR